MSLPRRKGRPPQTPLSPTKNRSATNNSSATKTLTRHAARRQARQRDLVVALDTATVALRQCIRFDDEAHSRLLALWVAHCHAIGAACFTPIILITSPVPGCGKTTLIKELMELLPEGIGIHAIRPSVASIYRLLGVDEDDAAPTPRVLFIDEADSIFKRGDRNSDAEQLAAVLNAGYERTGVVPRVNERRTKVERFHCFAPKVIAAWDSGTFALPGATRTRSIHIPLQKATKEEKRGLQEFRPELAPIEFHPVRDELGRMLAGEQAWAQLRAREIAEFNGFDSRQLDISKSMIAIADQAGGHWPDTAREALEVVFKPTRDDDHVMPTNLRLLSDCRVLFRRRGRHESLLSHDLCELLNDEEDWPYSRWNNGKGATPLDVANYLRPFKVNPHNVRVDGMQRKGYKREDFKEAWRRNLVDDDRKEIELGKPEVREKSKPKIGSKLRESLNK